MSNPINKGAPEPERRLPQINNRFTIAVLNAGARAAQKIVSQLKPKARPGREERFRARLTRAVAETPAGTEVERLGPLSVQVSVHQAFGKPTLISADVVLDEEQTEVAREHASSSTLFRDMLERLTVAIWDNPEIAPAGARARIVGVNPDGSQITLLDMTDLDFVDEAARPADLFDRYGAPAGDPGWRP